MQVKAATIQEATGKENTEEEMLNVVINDFSNMAEEPKETIGLAQKERRFS